MRSTSSCPERATRITERCATWGSPWAAPKSSPPGMFTSSLLYTFVNFDHLFHQWQDLGLYTASDHWIFPVWSFSLEFQAGTPAHATCLKCSWHAAQLLHNIMFVLHSIKRAPMYAWVKKHWSCLSHAIDLLNCLFFFMARWGRGFGLVQYFVAQDSPINQPNSVLGIIFYSLQMGLGEHAILLQITEHVICNTVPQLKYLCIVNVAAF